MPIAKAKFDRRCARQATEQRAQAKARLLGGSPTREAINDVSRAFRDLGQAITDATPTLRETLEALVPTATINGTLTITFPPGEYVIDGNVAPVTWYTMAADGNGTPIYWSSPDMSAEDLEIQRVAYEKQRREAELAQDRALDLFVSFLTPQQRKDYEKHKYINVTGSLGRPYRIMCHGQSGNVQRLDNKGKPDVSLCAHPYPYVPNGDAWLVQKLTLENDEAKFCSIANVMGGFYR